MVRHKSRVGQGVDPAVGLLATVGDVTVGGRTYARSFDLRFDAVAEPRCGLPFEPLVQRLRFITKKEHWGGVLRRPVVRLPDADFALIEKRFRAHCARVRASGRA
jgi:hypothetical protein